jgi:1-acyl-sn-glycerol-3-phosphate acyltransferase
MHRTIFDTPVVNTVLRGLSLAVLKLAGWKVSGQLPANGRKCVLIAAPHTSNWDLPYTLMVAFALRLNIYWMGKEQIFKPPFDDVAGRHSGAPRERQQPGGSVHRIAAKRRRPGATGGAA